ncbi:hypothetical protein EFA69_06090 [Rufibacter immobilis]|uniref:Uncharacterized protein n=1 Tax=Rufibacter immobilis TaxID=1348778 RepID=A0A3M9N384_9BACT|nr:ThiF family adenylyltransferase [Rufibacter immobilis]RNI31767.1 hypothetical protein EFA69_06090 [Rufibacter immobilis]
MNHLPWYKANPYFLQREIDALTAAGVAFEIDATADSQGIMKINLVIENTNSNFDLAGMPGPISLEANFPDNYPYFRPEVHALNINLPRHFNPFGKNLCLIPRPTENWDLDWTLVSFLQSQLPKVLVKGAITDPELILADPDEQAEPVSEYYNALNNPVIFDGTAFDAIPTMEAGIAQIGKIRVGLPEKATLPTRMAVLEAFAMDGQSISQLPGSFNKLFPAKFEGVLVRLSERPPHGNGPDDLKWLNSLIAKQTNIATLNRKPLLLKDGTKITGIIGLNFPEEVGPGVMGLGWLFLVTGTVNEQVAIGKKKPQTVTKNFAYYAKAIRVGESDLQIRAPKLVGLKQHKIAVVGLGALGGPAAIEFARNQMGELRLMDYDIVEPAPTVRWPLGLASAGLLKTEALETFIAENYPQTKVKAFHHRVGGVRPFAPNIKEGLPTEQQTMEELLGGVSLLFDASAESGVSHFLSEEAKRRKIPYICIHATPGAWGGLVMRVVPGKTEGCWMCFKHAQNTGLIPVPVKDDAGEIQAAGCGNQTFTGASFDLQNVTLAGVRLAISTILSDTPGGYPDFSWDVGVVKLMDDQNPIAPIWETFPLKRHPECPYCSGE